MAIKIHNSEKNHKWGGRFGWRLQCFYVKSINSNEFCWQSQIAKCAATVLFPSLNNVDTIPQPYQLIPGSWALGRQISMQTVQPVYR